MVRFGSRGFIWLISLLWLPLTAAAQNAVPDFRYIVTRNMDFFGSDLDALFDTDINACVRACTANPRCTAFTFNSRSSACFPKGGVSDRTPYDGAISAEKVLNDANIQTQAQPRAQALGFLGETNLTGAERQGRHLGLRHNAGTYDLETLLNSARAFTSSGNYLQASNLTGSAISLTDRADLWTEYARLLLQIPTKKSSTRRRNAGRATLAAVNGYLRAQSAPARANALVILSEALEQSNRGRLMIPALRLAMGEQPRDDIENALELAIGKYGFRITGSTVESDSATPKICAEFSDPLVKVGTDYEPFVRVDQTDLSVQASGNRLCVDGVEHGKRYRITFRKGLPALNGETLWKDVEVVQYVRDRSPSVRFPGRSYVLPKSASAALPVETVNTTELDLRLRKVSDRNLLRAIQDGYFGRPLSYWQDETFSSEIADEIWTGKATVSSDLNRDVTTRLPMAEAIAGQSAGIYALTASVPGTDPYDDAGATQWFVLSDLGISSFSGTGGLDVMVRSLSDASARSGIEVTLVSRANAVLGRATTDSGGFARFEPGLTRGTGGSAPALVLAGDGEKDVGFLSLTDPAFDLSDRGVDGRPPSGPVDVFLTTDRGAYRAGERIHVTALTRDGNMKAIEGLPLIAILTRPDGVEYSRQISDGGTAGGHVFDFPVGVTVPRGSWRLDLKTDPDAAAVATQTVLVEDFLPERIDFDLALPDTPIGIGTSPVLTIDARYLFGAPGADLDVEGQVTLRAAEQIESWPGYRFGRYDERSSARSSFFSGDRTDARGHASVPLELPEPDVAGKPMEIAVTVRLADGSARPVERQISAPVLPRTPVIGIRPLFEDVVGEGTEASFDIIALSPDLTPEPMQVRWTLNRVVTRYQWYQLYGDWNWEPTTHRTPVASGEGAITDQPISVSHPVDWGRYELVVERVGGDYIAAAADFYAGWYAPADASSTPDRLEMSLDQPDYSIGDTAILRVVPRAAGTALVTVMSNRVISRQVVEVPAGPSRIPIPVTEDWGTGAYVSATVIRPMDLEAGQNPARSLGIAHAKIAPGAKALNVAIDVPDVSRPRQTQTAQVTVIGTGGETAWLTLAAVDVGILNLTGFESPDPQGHYFGQRRLGVELRDVYGRLIDGMNGAMGLVRSGGDAETGARMQSPPPTQDLMASFSGPVQFDQNGEATVAIDLPAFNGTVRFMAVAWTNTAVGQAERDMFVRDPVVVTASVPRFLAPGDSSRVRLEVIHADGPAGQMNLQVTGTGTDLSVGAGPGTFLLDAGAKAVFTVPVSANAAGDPEIHVALTTPAGEVLDQTLRLPVRNNDPEIASTQRFTLAAGGSFIFSNDVFDGLRPGTGKAILSAGPLARFDAPGLLSSLDRYPYGCTEQITSRALPLLYLSSVAKATGLGSGPDVQDRVDDAVARVLTRQASNGAFGLWRAESGDFWLDAYVSDFLSRARTKGYDVPDLPFRMAMDNLRNRISYAPDFDKGGRDIAYALMVLAREGAAAMGDLRYYSDVKGDAFDTPLAAAQVGAALASYGDQSRADAMFARAARMIEARGNEAPVWRADYGTGLRDSAAVLALATEAGSQAVNADRLTRQVTAANGHLSTQEAAWTLLAAQALVKSDEQSGLAVNGAAVTGPFVQVLEDRPDQRDLSVAAATGKDTDITLTTIGIPEISPQAGGNGYRIEREYYDMDGNSIAGRTFAVGDRLVAVLRVFAFENKEARLMINDPLPAGFEIDNPNLLRSGDVGALDWLKLSEAEHSEFRSDRFLSAVNIRDGNQVTLSYIVRAVTPGQFHHPAATVEDMYRPRYRAHTDTGQVLVKE